MNIDAMVKLVLNDPNVLKAVADAIKNVIHTSPQTQSQPSPIPPESNRADTSDSSRTKYQHSSHIHHPEGVKKLQVFIFEDYSERGAAIFTSLPDFSEHKEKIRKSLAPKKITYQKNLKMADIQFRGFVISKTSVQDIITILIGCGMAPFLTKKEFFANIFENHQTPESFYVDTGSQSLDESYTTSHILGICYTDVPATLQIQSSSSQYTNEYSHPEGVSSIGGEGVSVEGDNSMHALVVTKDKKYGNMIISKGPLAKKKFVVAKFGDLGSFIVGSQNVKTPPNLKHPLKTLIPLTNDDIAFIVDCYGDDGYVFDKDLFGEVDTLNSELRCIWQLYYGGENGCEDIDEFRACFGSTGSITNTTSTTKEGCDSETSLPSEEE